MEMKQGILFWVVIPRNGGKWMFQIHRLKECVPVSAWRGGTAPLGHTGNSERLPSSWKGAASWDRAATQHRRLQDGPAGKNWAGKSRFGQDLGVTAEQEELP